MIFMLGGLRAALFCLKTAMVSAESNRRPLECHCQKVVDTPESYGNNGKYGSFAAIKIPLFPVFSGVFPVG
jgi:hypothetical protein